MPRQTKLAHWPSYLEPDSDFGNSRYNVSLNREQRAFLNRIFPREFIEEIAKRYSFDLTQTPFQQALFAAAHSFLRSSRIEHKRKSGERKQTQKLREEQLRAIEKFIELHEIEPDFEAWSNSPQENPTLLKLERLVLNAMEHQDRERALSEVWNFRKSFSTFYEDIAERKIFAEYRAANFKPATRGRPMNQGDFYFVATLSHFWSDDLKRPLTLDVYKGEGLTESFKFIKDCAEPINGLDKEEFGKISNSQITTMIRKYRVEKPKWEKSLQEIDSDAPF